MHTSITPGQTLDISPMPASAFSHICMKKKKEEGRTKDHPAISASFSEQANRTARDRLKKPVSIQLGFVPSTITRLLASCLYSVPFHLLFCPFNLPTHHIPSLVVSTLIPTLVNSNLILCVMYVCQACCSFMLYCGRRTFGRHGGMACVA